LWQRLYDRDPNVIGQSLRLNEEEYNIVGVMPASFRFPQPDFKMWVSMAQVYRMSGRPGVANWLTSRGMRGYRVVGRLKQDVTLEQARSDMDMLQERLGEQYPDARDMRVTIVPLREQMVGRVERPLMVLLAGVGFVLLIACVNVANLMLARATSREREIAIRRALGASSRRITLQVLTESVLLSVIGGGLGVLLAMWGVEFFVRISPPAIPRLESVQLDRTVLLFALTTTVATGLLFGLVPAIKSRRTDLYNSLREGTRDAADPAGSRRARQALVVVEVALAVVLVAGAGLMINSFLRLMRVNPGFDPEGLLTLNVSISLNRYTTPADQILYMNSVLERVRKVPGVQQAGAATSLPPNLIQQSDGFTVDDEPPSNSTNTAFFVPATPGYLEALGLPLVAGRLFTDSDGIDQPRVAVINRGISERFFSDRDPIGRRINIAGEARTIVGVVGDTRFQGLATPAGYQVYVPFAQRRFPGMRTVVRSNVDPASVIGAVREAIRSVDPGESGSQYRPMTELIDSSIREPRFYTMLLGVFGFVALTLAAVGIFGVISYSVSRRTREIGVRVALGASREGVVAMVLWESFRVISFGLLLGIGAAFALTRLLGNLLFEVRPADPATFASVVGLLLLIGLAAAFFPARRAANVDPMVALRCE
jgi:putative ABC transport system permease protein